MKRSILLAISDDSSTREEEEATKKTQGSLKTPLSQQQSNQPYNRLQRKCYKCGSMEHTHWKCKAPKKESAVQPGEQSGTKTVTSATSKDPAFPVPALRL